MSGSAVEFMRNFPEGGFAAAATCALPSYQHGFAVSDVNGDGVPDILSVASDRSPKHRQCKNAKGFRGQSFNYQIITRRPATRFAASGLPQVWSSTRTGIISGRSHESERLKSRPSRETVSTDSLKLDIRVRITQGLCRRARRRCEARLWNKAFVAFLWATRSLYGSVAPQWREDSSARQVR